MHPSAKLSIAELRIKCHTDDYTKFIHRPARAVTIYFTKFFLIIGLTANMVSTIGFALFLFSFALFLYDEGAFRYWGIGLMIFAEFFDYLDGELARAYGHSTKMGLFLEPFFQDIIYTLIFIVIGIGVFNETNNPIYLYLGIAASFGKVLFRLLEMRYRKHMESFGPQNSTHTNPVSSTFTTTTFSIFKIPYYIALFFHHNLLSGAALLYFLFALTLLGRINLFLWFYGICLPVIWLALAVMRLQAIKSLDAQAVK